MRRHLKKRESFAPEESVRQARASMAQGGCVRQFHYVTGCSKKPSQLGSGSWPWSLEWSRPPEAPQGPPRRKKKKLHEEAKLASVIFYVGEKIV